MAVSWVVRVLSLVFVLLASTVCHERCRDIAMMKVSSCSSGKGLMELPFERYRRVIVLLTMKPNATQKLNTIYTTILQYTSYHIIVV